MDYIIQWFANPAAPFKLWLLLTLVFFSRVSSPRYVRALLTFSCGMVTVCYEAMVVGDWSSERWLFHIVAVSAVTAAVYFSVRKTARSDQV